MGKRGRLSCNDCYFRQLGLCALALDAPCPTFRLRERGTLAAPRQATLVVRALPADDTMRLVPEHQAA